jgi:ATP-dependent exoDNAse (exonuclease V) alpha subunit
MMLARTRVDVDRLNALAKSAAQRDGRSHGPEVVVGELCLRAGDVIRTRRNNRGLLLGESHVRNGDCYRVLATTEDGALLVDELTGRGSTVLPPRYVTEHVDHGWATTIDAAQGATTDVAVLLVRPGMDREHLYVGLTRGRDENHAYIAPLAEENDQHRTPAEADIARRILESALAYTSTDNAAHTLLDRSRGAIPPSSGPARVGWRPAAIHPERPTADTTTRRTPAISGP